MPSTTSDPAVVDSLVSTIIPVHNRPDQLRDAVASVLAQCHPELEVIIVDDGSDDATPDVADDLATDTRVRWLRIDNGGPGVAREAGRREARGSFIQYLDSDDVLYPGKFTRQVEALERNPECGVAYCATAYRMLDGSLREVMAEKRTTERFDTMWPSFLTGRWWNTLTPLYRRSVCDRVGPWSDLRQEEDWEYDSRVASLGGKLCRVEAVLCEFRQHDGTRASASGLPLADRLRHRARARELILDNARAAGLGPETPEMQHFARSAFLLSRQCGGAGLAQEAAALYRLSRRAAGDAAGRDHRLYGLLARLLGWRTMGRLSAWFDQSRP